MPAGVNANLWKNLITWLGKDEDAFLPIALMCVANGTLKPLITLSNPKEKPERKMYAAKREFLNEMVALPVCFAFAKGFGAAGTAFIKPALKKLKPEVATSRLNLMKTTVFSALGVISANFAVPSLANALFHPLDRWSAPLFKKFQKNAQPLPASDTTVKTEKSEQPAASPTLPQPAFGQRLIRPNFDRTHPFNPSISRCPVSFASMPGYGGLRP